MIHARKKLCVHRHIYLRVCFSVGLLIYPPSFHNDFLVLSFSFLSWCSVHLSSLPLPWCLLLDGVSSSFPNGRWSKSSIPPPPPPPLLLSLSLSLQNIPYPARPSEGDTQRNTQRQRGRKTETRWEATGGEEGKMLTFSVPQNDTSHLTKQPWRT